jgi:hypothetical protein
MKLWFETKLEKFGGPFKDLFGPPEGCSPPVEKHCIKRLITAFTVGII